MLDAEGLLFCRYGLFYRNDVHADPGSSRGNHRRNLLKGQKGHPFEHPCHLRMGFHLLFVHVHKLCTARYEHGQDVLLVMVRIFPVVFQKADDAHLFHQLVGQLHTFAALLCDGFRRGRHSHLHGQSHFCHLIRHYTRQSVVFRIFYGDFVADAVSNLLTEFYDQFSLLCHYSFLQSSTSHLSQSVQDSNPSPVFADTKKISAFGFSL